MSISFTKTVQRHYLNLTAPDNASLNWSWQKCRKVFLKKNGKICACCGYTKKIEVHHMLPRHIRPDLTLIHKNLIALCDDCHFHVGHLNSYHFYNKNVDLVCSLVAENSIKKENK